MYMQPAPDSKMWLSCYRDIKPKTKKYIPSERGQAVWKPDTRLSKHEVFTELSRQLSAT